MYATILHATDLKENHFAMCQKAVAIAKAFGGTLHLLHVIEPPASLQLAQGLGFAELGNPVKDDAVTVMNVLGEALSLPVAQQHVAIGSIKQLVLKKVKELGCDLVIIGSHTPGHLPAFLGSTAHAVVHHAPCDVLTIRI
ncbi:universal stress protein A UspA [Legionella rubrilucens]|uniref:Universal stress protein n=1 Tax=Legionella rubrilucens TaxID=458 RepID=A0A0W0Y648_9GAMM|nr:universal stress protein [Legionella rubrilucens]KTD52439.1 universal stress protein A UspA [Legionella rubrilucens]